MGLVFGLWSLVFGLGTWDLGLWTRLGHRSVVQRRFVSERRDRNIGNSFTLVDHAHVVTFAHSANNYRVEIPLAKYVNHLSFASGVGNDQHPLLRLGQQHLVCRLLLEKKKNQKQICFSLCICPRLQLT